MKPYDGLRDAGVLEDDDTRHMVRLTLAAGEPDRDMPRVVLVIGSAGAA